MLVMAPEFLIFSRYGSDLEFQFDSIWPVEPCTDDGGTKGFWQRDKTLLHLTIDI